MADNISMRIIQIQIASNSKFEIKLISHIDSFECPFFSFFFFLYYHHLSIMTWKKKHPTNPDNKRIFFKIGNGQIISLSDLKM